jgi:hypothetical protein
LPLTETRFGSAFLDAQSPRRLIARQGDDMAVLYMVDVDDESSDRGAVAFPTLKAARNFIAEHEYEIASIRRIETPPKMALRDLLCALFNGEGYAASSQTVYEKGYS